MPKHGFSQARILPYNDRIEDILAYFTKSKISQKTLNFKVKSGLLFQLQ